jgi:peptidoglycan hydrolase-like protein with peptidoglycan-binding domain
MTDSDNTDSQALSGAMYFIVGRGTEGGSASYRLSVAGVTDAHWGEASHVKANSGYSIGTIQVDLGQRGTWPLGSIDGQGSADQPSYVDAVISQSSAYAKAHGLAFPKDHDQLRSDLLTHGNGTHGRTTISFISAESRGSINAWAASDEGKKWIHSNVDFPQVKNATESAIKMVDSAGTKITDDHRLETVAILTKTANQFPTQLTRFQTVLENGGTYEDVLSTAQAIKDQYAYYDGPKAAQIASAYKEAIADPTRKESIENAQKRVAEKDFDPSQANDPDIREALRAIGAGSHVQSAHTSQALRTGSHGNGVNNLQNQLNELGIKGAGGVPLTADGHFGPATQAAVEAFQRSHGMTVDGVAGPRTQQALQDDVNQARTASRMSLSDAHHPGVSLYTQALEGVRSIDQQRGRTTDQASCNLAGSLAVAACSEGMRRIDHVVMSDDGARAYAVQGDMKSPFKIHTHVDVAQAVTTPLEQSGTAFLQAAQQQSDRAATQQQEQAQNQAAPTHHPAMHR